MRVRIHDTSVSLWLSANDTYQWAHNWPYSELSSRRLYVCFDSNGLCDLAIDGRNDIDVSANELNAITSDYLAKRLPRNHPCWFVAVGQFQQA
jgi:hypothetical protein